MAAADRRVRGVRHPSLTIGLLSCLLLAPAGVDAAEFVWPLAHPQRVSSTFGTYRIGHHHAGLDLTTDGDQSVAVVAIADGEVVRLRRGDRGFGRAVYIAHAGALVSVYAHLSAFGPVLADAVAEAEERSGAFAFKAWPRPAIPVKQGDVLGWIGTSGTDLLHLHFEMRKGGQPVNPFTHGLPMHDTRPPVLRRLLAIPRTPSSHVEGRLDERMYRFDADGNLDEPVVLRGDVRLMVEAVDFIDGMSRAVSPYSVELFIDGRRWHRSVYERVSYDDKGHTELDYHPRLRAHGEGVFHTLVEGKGPPVRAHRKVGRRLTALKAGTHQARIVTKDAAGHTTEGRFVIQVERAPPCKPRRRRLKGHRRAGPVTAPFLRDDLLAIPVPELCDADGVYDVRVDGKRFKGAVPTRVGEVPALALTVPGDERAVVEVGVTTEAGPVWQRVETIGGPEKESMVFGPIELRIGEESRFWSYPTLLEATLENPGGPGLDPVTPLYRLANGWVPTKKGSTLGVKMPANMPPRSALYFHERGRWWWMGRTRRGRFMRGWTVHWGEYAIMTDSEPPEIGPPRIERHVAGSRLVVPVADEGSGLRRVELTIDGEPVMFERQRAWARVLYQPIVPVPPGPHRVVVEVEDRVGQTDRLEATVVWPAPPARESDDAPLAPDDARPDAGSDAAPSDAATGRRDPPAIGDDAPVAPGPSVDSP